MYVIKKNPHIVVSFLTFVCFCVVITQVVRFTVQGSGLFRLRQVTLFILLEIVDEPMNGSSYAQYATPEYLKTIQLSSVNLEP